MHDLYQNEICIHKDDWNLDVIGFPECHGLRIGEPSKHNYFIREMWMIFFHAVLQ